MLIYYLVVLTSAIIFFLFLVWLRNFYPGLSFKLIGTLVLWVFAISLFLPGIISFIPPVLVFIGVFPLVLCGGYIIFKRITVSEAQLDETVSEEITEEAVFERINGEIKPESEEEKPKLAEFTKKVEELFAEEEAFETEPAPIIETEAPLQSSQVPLAAIPLPRELFKLPKHLTLISPLQDDQFLLLSPGSTEQDKEVSLLTEHEFSFEKLISRAFQAKEEKDYALAAENFKAALSLTGDVSIKGMIYTEFVFIYKEMGKYLEAADLVEKFLSESGSLLSASLRIHFEKVIKYLQTIDELLKKAEHPDPAFSQIPHLIKIRAEKIFQE